MSWDGRPAFTRQRGYVGVPVTSSRQGSIAVTFPAAFPASSTVYVMISSNHPNCLASYATATPTGFIAQVNQIDGTVFTGTIGVSWTAEI